ncbi:MAG: hypothetical protein GY744_06510, partial [Gammaproteobacteria bacterium]|nr:hypothetical protein [Gammaproteobacteria bacterium]
MFRIPIKAYLFLSVIIACCIIIISSCDGIKTDEKHDSAETTIDSIGYPLAFISQKISLDSLNAGLYNERAKLYIQRKQINNAFTDVNRALELNQAEAEYYITLSDIYMLMGKMQKSLNSLKKANELSPDEPGPLLKIAEIH